MEITAELATPVSARDHIEGLDSAALTLVEYGDYQCPYCGAAFPVVERLRKKLGKKLRFVFRNFPLTESHPYALIAAEAAETAALQGKFWEMHDLIYEQQESLAPEMIPVWAKQIGLDVRKFADDIRLGTAAARIQEDRRSGIRSGVNGTPAFYINGARYDDSPDYGSLLGALEAELE